MLLSASHSYRVAGLRSTFRAAVRLNSTTASASASATANANISETSTSAGEKVQIIEPEQTDAGRNRIFNKVMFQPQNRLYNDPLVSRFIPELERRRIVPSMPTFYARNPYHELHMSKLQDVLNKNMTLPFDRKKSTSSWIKFKQYKEKAGGQLLKETEYLQLLNVLKRLDSIDIELRSDELNEILAEYQRKLNDINTSKEAKTLDDKGRAIAIGRRKSSSAKLYLVEGTGEVLINGKPLEQMFPKQQDRLKLLYPLQIVEAENKFNIFGLSRGGGSTGQIDSLQLALARALCIYNPLYKQRLSSAGVLHRDPRTVERKKPGKRKARKMPTWVKR